MRILLAEPSRIGRAIVEAMLAEDGHDVVSCETAEQALQIVTTDERIEVLVTAIEFASMSGLELCWETRLQADQARPLHVIVLSSSQDEFKLAEALDCGADDFIQKPPRKHEFLARLRAASRLIQAQRALIQHAMFDSLTGLRNRRSFFEEMEKRASGSVGSCMIMLDVDHFKRVNDQYGHDAGDEVLRAVAQHLLEADKGFARLGGEEFALHVNAPLPIAQGLAERVRQAIAAAPVATAGETIPVTVSIGIAERLPGQKLETTLSEADRALYQAKAGGRNRVAIAGAATDCRITPLKQSA
jgi:diguanylate cyclase (GGDEF)-like protein